MLNVRFSILDGLKRFDNMPHKVPITNDSLKLARSARQSYQNYLDEQKLIAEEEQKRAAADEERRKKEKAISDQFDSDVKTLKSLETELLKEEQIYNNCIKEANSMQKLVRTTT